MIGKGRATSYTDYYKNNSTPDSDLSDTSSKTPFQSRVNEEDDAKKARKKALQRRLKMAKMRTGRNGTA